MKKQTIEVCKLHLLGGVAYSTIGVGVVTAAGLEDIGRRTMVALAGAAPSVYLGDFRRSVWALRTSHLDAFFDGADPALLTPAALVVPEVYLSMFRAHAWNVAQGGILRKVFTDYAAASRWCRLRSLIHRPAQIAP